MTTATMSPRPGKEPADAMQNPAKARKLDAIELLKADHRQVEAWFKEFNRSDDIDTQETLAADICLALEVHAQIEEEIFYPAFLKATGDEDMHHEAVVEHEGAKELIAKIADDDADGEYFEARVKVLSEMIKHHVREEEQSGGMFELARKSEMKLDSLGALMEARKLELMAAAKAEEEARSEGAAKPVRQAEEGSR